MEGNKNIIILGKKKSHPCSVNWKKKKEEEEDRNMNKLNIVAETVGLASKIM